MTMMDNWWLVTASQQVQLQTLRQFFFQKVDLTGRFVEAYNTVNDGRLVVSECYANTCDAERSKLSVPLTEMARDWIRRGDALHARLRQVDCVRCRPQHSQRSILLPLRVTSLNDIITRSAGLWTMSKLVVISTKISINLWLISIKNQSTKKTVCRLSVTSFRNETSVCFS